MLSRLETFSCDLSKSYFVLSNSFLIAPVFLFFGGGGGGRGRRSKNDVRYSVVHRNRYSVRTISFKCHLSRITKPYNEDCDGFMMSTVMFIAFYNFVCIGIPRTRVWCEWRMTMENQTRCLISSCFQSHGWLKVNNPGGKIDASRCFS